MNSEALGGGAVSQWAQTLGVSRQAIHAWLADQALPSPENLGFIVSHARKSSLADEQKRELERVLRLPSITVTPLWRRVGRTLGDYILGPRRKAIESMVAAVPAAVQEALLEDIRLLIEVYSAEGAESIQEPLFGEIARKALSFTDQKRASLVQYIRRLFNRAAEGLEDGSTPGSARYRRAGDWGSRALALRAANWPSDSVPIFGTQNIVSPNDVTVLVQAINKSPLAWPMAADLDECECFSTNARKHQAKAPSYYCSSMIGRTALFANFERKNSLAFCIAHHHMLLMFSPFEEYFKHIHPDVQGDYQVEVRSGLSAFPRWFEASSGDPILRQCESRLAELTK